MNAMSDADRAAVRNNMARVLSNIFSKKHADCGYEVKFTFVPKNENRRENT